MNSPIIIGTGPVGIRAVEELSERDPALAVSLYGDETVVATQHNQNKNLRPNEKMLRSVCLHCHSLEFSIDALADKNLIANNFTGTPGVHIRSIDMAKKRK